MEQLKSWLRERHQLPVAVYSTPAAEAVLARNGLTIVDYLRPLALVNKLNAPMRVGEYSTRIQEVKLSLYEAGTMYQPKPEVIDEALRQGLAMQAQRHASLQPVPNLIQHVQSEPPEMLNPWFYAYQAEFMRLLKFTEHETLDHPVGGLFFMPADTPGPLLTAEKLLATPAMPLQASQAMLPLSDPLFAKHWVLVQDVGAPGMDDARALNNLATLSNTYGAANCSILRLHGRSSGGGGSAAAGNAGAVPASVFQACRRATLPGGGAGEPDQRPQEPPGGLGTGLSPDDMAAAGQLLRDFAERTLLPKIEERIARMNLAVSTARKGLKNRLTRFWKGAAAEPGPSQDVSYPYHSVEGQMRALADLAYLLGQYEFAVQMYRLAAQDYLAAPNSKWYAGAEEMIGICSILMSDPAADPLKYLNRAFEHYSKVRGRQGRMLATRTMLDAAAYQAATGRHLSANMSFMRAHFDEEAARAALLLEAAAYSLLRCRPPAVRKAAFHLVLAGLRYHAAKQKRLAIHCYKQVTTIYSAGTWRHISEHLHDILGKQCAELGDVQGSLIHCTALLDCGHRQAAAQAHYLSRFLEAIQAARVKGPLQDLRLPEVATDTVVVRYADQRCYVTHPSPTLLGGSSSNVTAATDSESGLGASETSHADSVVAVWGQLEQSLAGGDVPSTNWLDGAKQVHDGEEFNTVAAGEDVSVEVTFRNPLAVKLSLSRVRLMVQFTPSPAPGATAGSSSTSPQHQQPQQSADAASDAAPRPDQVMVVESQFSLHPGEVLTELLTVKLVAAGWLRIVGVAWLLNGVAEGAAEFDVKGRRRKRPKGDRPSQRKHYPPHRRLVFHIVKGMPRLQLSLDGLPAEAAAGELLRVQVQLRNVGLMPASNLKVAVSSPAVALAAVQQGGAVNTADKDVWQQLTGAADVIAPVRSKAMMHRRHKSSGATLAHHTDSSTGSPDHKRYASSFDGGSSNTVAAAAPADDLHMPHIHSMPVVHEAVAAAATSGSGSFDGQQQQQQRPAAAAAAATVFQIGGTDLVLEPGQCITVPMWVHVQQPGRFVFQCAWFCEPQVSVSTSMRYRVLLTHHSIAVSNLLELAPPSVSPCVKDLRCYNLRLQATASKDASGVLALHQLSCLSAGIDAGWRMRSFTAAAAALPGSNSASGTSDRAGLQQSMLLGVKLGAGESCTHFVQLISPAAAADRGNQAAAVASAAGSLGSRVLPVLQGPLQYFYKRGLEPTAGPAVGQRSGDNPAATASLQQPLTTMQLLPTAARPLVTEPRVDLLLLWRFESQHTNTAAGEQQQQQVRAGFTSYYDLCAAQQLNPIRMTLDGPGLGAPHKHDFRAASLCIVPLTLKLRNCGTASVSLAVRAAGAWEGLSAEHAWWATPAPPGSKFSGLLGSSAAAAAAAGSTGGSASTVAAAPASLASPPVAATSTYGPQSAGAATLGGLPPRPRTPQAAAAAAAGLAGGLVGVAGEGLGSVFSGLGVRGASPLRGSAGDGSGSSSARDSPRQAPGGWQQQQQAVAAGTFPAADTAGAAVQAGLPPCTEHVWCGNTCVPVQRLEPGASVEVVLQVAVFKPGVYVIDDYGIDWRCDALVWTGGRVRQGSKVGEAIVLKVDST